MAGKCDRNKYRIVWHPKGFPHHSPHSLWQPDAEFTLHLTSPYLHGETAWTRNNSIAGFYLSVSIFQHAERWNEREWRKKKKCVKEITAKQRNVWYRLGLWRWVQSQTCVFVIKQVLISHLRKKNKDFFFPSKTLCFAVVFLLQHHKHSFSPTSKVWPHPFIGSSFWKTVLLIFILLKKKVHEFIRATGGRVCSWICLQSNPKSVTKSAIDKQLETF